MMSKHTRRTALCLALILALMILISAAVTAAEAGHECSGEDCPICIFAAAIRSLTVTASAAAVFALLFFRTSSPIRTAFSTDAVIFDTPVTKKVKLLN